MIFQHPLIVILAKAGIQGEASTGGRMDSRFRGNDDKENHPTD
jgi:hypothetical protein